MPLLLLQIAAAVFIPVQFDSDGRSGNEQAIERGLGK